ncbi:MAG: hypothetical protein HZA90_23495 [Verrucomicrobia bacterium]|nr:hypothetical protein [Verrucomicrobiota bacterium]
MSKATEHISEAAWAKRPAGVAPAARSREGGAVLLEVILALVLFVAAAAVITVGMNASLDSVERQRLNAHAMDLAVSVMSEIQMGLRSTAVLGPEDFEEPFDGWSWELQVTPVETDLGETSVLTTVEVIIRHTESGLTHRLAQLVRPGTVTAVGKESDASATP